MIGFCGISHSSVWMLRFGIGVRSMSICNSMKLHRIVHRNVSKTVSISMKSSSSNESISNEFITLGQFIKVQGIAETGGQAKSMIQSGEISVNGTVETRRGRKLFKNDVVSFDTQSITVQFDSIETFE
uniref:RNA-binding S4 domain-containing protein n=1 Tax=Timspurckia oligopyrenoides TaxID=708627 RepID=A0A7S0ZKM4_9RHOD|mmetsp:Transcript_8959/g.16142  ORF Transcript_8959/g.16142 Transcript_8959/m.16142 type:complete len:128 (+) Transcript_8959:29-412(+)